MKIYKFGGASVRNAEGIRNMMEIVGQADDDLIVVVSAMGKTTNALEAVVDAAFSGNREGTFAALNVVRTYHYDLLRDLYTTGYVFQQAKVELYLEQIVEIVEAFWNNRHAYDSEAHQLSMSYDAFYDSIVSFGELISTHLIFLAFVKAGVPCELMHMPSLLRTDDTFREAKVDMEEAKALLRNFLDTEHRIQNTEHRTQNTEHRTQNTEQRTQNTEHRTLYIAQGFIGGTADGRRTTLGREGSDYTAAVLANLVDAESVTIWKDVPGILNADPRLFEKTTLISELTYYDAVELAYSGAQIIHPKTIRPLENKRIPLYVRPFAAYTEAGSVIKDTTSQPIDVPVYIWRKNQILITVRPKDFAFVLEESLHNLFETIQEHRLKVSLIQSSAVTISVCVDNSRYLQPALAELQNDYAVTFNENLSLLTIRGTTPAIIEEITAGKDILLTQTTRRTARFVIRKE